MAESVTSRDRIEKLLKEIGELKGPIERTLMDVREIWPPSTRPSGHRRPSNSPRRQNNR
jgi:hypothetical protein